MPNRSREMNDQPTEARIRQIIRSILDQEVRRLLTSAGVLSATVATNTGNISANASSIAANIIEICNNERRVAMAPNNGLVSTQSISGIGTSPDTTVTTPFAKTGSVWTISIAMQPIGITLWSLQGTLPVAVFDTFVFDAARFDDQIEVLTIDQAPGVTYAPDTQLLSIDWSTSKSGTLHKITSGDFTYIVAVAD